MDLKNGVFHSYPKNSTDHYTMLRDGELQHETNISNGDTVLWKVEWQSECRYTLKYISGGNKMSAEAIGFIKNHLLAFEIIEITNDYYIFDGYIDRVSTSKNILQTDTMWLTERTQPINNELIKQIPNPAALRKAHFSDSSKYAVLYIYRPGKFTNSLGNYPVYINDNLLCIAKNKSGYIFKILKEGKFEIKSKLLKDESSIQLDVKFGSKYYVKSMIHWGIYKRLYNFKLDMAIMKPDLGETEFEEVNLQ